MGSPIWRTVAECCGHGRRKDGLDGREIDAKAPLCTGVAARCEASAARGQAAESRRDGDARCGGQGSEGDDGRRKGIGLRVVRIVRCLTCGVRRPAGGPKQRPRCP